VLGRKLFNQFRAPSRGLSSWIIGRLWNRRNAVLNDFALARLELSVHDHVLDVGFGGGYLLERIAQVVSHGFAAGVDASDALVESLKRRCRPLVDSGRLDVRCGQVESLPYPDGYFNKCCSVNSLFYWTDVPRGIAEIYRVLTDGGRFVVCITCKQCLEKKSFAVDGIGLYQEDEICTLLADAGFQIVKMEQASDRYREFLCVVAER
jgi:ubiquinone/menaquinone biosynthesis C-methylase UbiE